MTSTLDWPALADGLAGELVLPDSADYDAVRKPPDPRFHDARPLAVVRCASPADVAETIGFARRAGLSLAIRSGGHCFAGRSSTDGVLLDVTPMDAVSVSGDRVRIGAGARLARVYDELAAYGVTIPAGCGPTVGIAGLTLGGGLGVLGRTYGLTCDRLRAARVVLADGQVVDCDERAHPDLFWALRGGVGGFGVVTELAFEPVPAPTMTRFRLDWPERHFPAVLETWQHWAPSAPDELAASLLVSVPDELERPPVASLVGTMLGSVSDVAPYLDQLVARIGVHPSTTERTQATHRETKRRLAEAGTERDEGYPYARSGFFDRPLPPDLVDGLLRQLTADRVPGQARILDCTPWGGAYNRVRPDATAFVHRAERFLVQHLVVVRPDAPGGTAAARDWLRASYRLTERARSGGVYQNFADSELGDPGRAYFGTNLDRLRRVNARYDPDRIFRAPYDNK